MLRIHRCLALWISIVGITAFSGCASSERAYVSFSYVVQPTRGLPEGMNTIYIKPAKIGPTTDPKWSELCAASLRSLVQESISQFGTRIELADRQDTQATFDEADLAAAGMSTGRAGSGGKLLAADGAILSNVNVKVTVDRGRQRTLSGLSLAGVRGRHWRGGGTDIRTSEVETVSRHLTVQMEYKLLDTANNKTWATYSPPPYTASDRTHASPIFGSSQTEASLTPTDEIIAGLVEQGAREFISQLMPCRVHVREDISSSLNKSCTQGIKMLRAEAYHEAMTFFKVALAENPGDHRAAFGAGLSSEALGQFDEALRYYNRACAEKLDEQYTRARDRVKAYANRT